MARQPWSARHRDRGANSSPDGAAHGEDSSGRISISLAGVAHLAEQLTCNQQVMGSTPIASSVIGRTTIPIRTMNESLLTVCSMRTTEGFPSGQREQTVNLPAQAYGGSNPPPSTATANAGVAQLVEREPSKLGVAGSNPVARSPLKSGGLVAAGGCYSHHLIRGVGSHRPPTPPRHGAAEPRRAFLEVGSVRGARGLRVQSAQVAQLAEHLLGKEEVGGSIPLLGSVPVRGPARGADAARTAPRHPRGAPQQGCVAPSLFPTMERG